jgi:hypothetical protein
MHFLGYDQLLRCRSSESVPCMWSPDCDPVIIHEPPSCQAIKSYSICRMSHFVSLLLSYGIKLVAWSKSWRRLRRKTGGPNWWHLCIGFTVEFLLWIPRIWQWSCPGRPSMLADWHHFHSFVFGLNCEDASWVQLYLVEYVYPFWIRLDLGSLFHPSRGRYLQRQRKTGGRLRV